MGGILLNGCRVGKDCLIGAGALVTEGTVIPDGCLAYGSPAGAVRPRWMRSNTTGRTRCTIWPRGAAAAGEAGKRPSSGQGPYASPALFPFRPRPGPESRGPKAPSRSSPRRRFPRVFSPASGRAFSSLFCSLSSGGRSQRLSPGARANEKTRADPTAIAFSLRLPPSSGERSQKLPPMRGKRRPTAPTTRPPLSRHRLRATSRSPAAQARGQPPQAQCRP